MQTMKKDMGGAACVLGLARAHHGREAPRPPSRDDPRSREQRLRHVLSSGRCTPGRKGLTVEIGNTDAEGRVILADALTEADQQIARPDADSPRPRSPEPRAPPTGMRAAAVSSPTTNISPPT